MNALDKRLEKARAIIEEGDFFRILTHYDVDGVCSAGIVASYLEEQDKRFHVSFLRNANREEILDIVKEEDYVILTDLGSSLVNELSGNVIVLDHHNPPGDSDKIVHVNPHLFGYDGAVEATATTMAYLLANNKKYVRYMLAGMLGDKQYLPAKGAMGLNREIIDGLGIKQDYLLPFHGPVGEAIFYSVEPFYVGLTGRRNNIEVALKNLGIEPVRDFKTLKEEEKVRLGSYLSLNLIKNSKIPEAGKFIVDIDFNVDGSVRHLTELIDAACRTNNQSIAFGYLLGERENFDKMEVLWRDYRSAVISEMYNVLENIRERSRVQYFYTKSSYLASTISTIATLYLLDPSKATLAIHMGDVVSVSARLHRSMVGKVDIGRIMKDVAAKLGGRGGGHNVAAGATLPPGTEEKFIELVNEEIEKSLSS